MDWTQTKSITDANLDQLLAKVSDPRAALSALEKKITGEVAKVEAHLQAMDARVLELPALLDQADAQVQKIDAVIAKARNDGRADLEAAAQARKTKLAGERATLDAELNGGIDEAQSEADAWLTKLQDKLVEVQVRLDRVPLPKPAPPTLDPAPAASPAPAKAAPAKPAPAKAAQKDDDDLAALDSLVAPPAPVAPKAAAPAKPGAPAGKKDALDDEFSALIAEMDVDLSKVELPKKKNAPAPLPDSDDGIPDLVAVRDDELPDGEELPPLEDPRKKGAAPAKGAPAPAAKAVTAPAKVAAPAAKAVPAVAAKAVPAAAQAGAPAEAKKSKTWLWVSVGLVTLGGAGAAVAHFVLHLF
jgi:hypothetical protein